MREVTGSIPVMAVCPAGESDRLWHISPPARVALLRLLEPSVGGGGGGGAGDGGGSGDGRDGCGDPPVVLEVRWSLVRSAPLGSQRGGPGCAAAAYVPLSGPSRRGLIEGATLSRFGITGLYVTFVFAIGRFLRLSVAALRLRIPTEDLPSTRRLVALCQDIAVARAEGELVLEDQLFQALINVYRSPELLIELSSRQTKRA
ncbi:hypothetical protein GPECTOR_58g571 [Gonium pectorale]|uniref:Piezo non-specific cation channel cap domain-containing protein n=1 Tax=Gonium pectorale TaxID=33097 RepID=A0A150G5J1_GONPE|nr:hypothetical protein GPECTOR_58g571 [Gonium pectorale]|eukprot:KXZ45122.1 hypothetical protein GPECTOR_58g571 [Gonium pectorale]